MDYDEVAGLIPRSMSTIARKWVFLDFRCTCFDS